MATSLYFYWDRRSRGTKVGVATSRYGKYVMPGGLIHYAS
jgi:hypothetical protein